MESKLSLHTLFDGDLASLVPLIFREKNLQQFSFMIYVIEGEELFQTAPTSNKNCVQQYCENMKYLQAASVLVIRFLRRFVLAVPAVRLCDVIIMSFFGIRMRNLHSSAGHYSAFDKMS